MRKLFVVVSLVVLLVGCGSPEVEVGTWRVGLADGRVIDLHQVNCDVWTNRSRYEMKTLEVKCYDKLYRRVFNGVAVSVEKVD